MNNKDNFDYKEKKDSWFNSYLINQKEKEKNIKTMMSNTDYLFWLDRFTQDKEVFYDDQWLYFSDKINDSDKKNVEKLKLFYEGIDEYANKNYIYPISWDYGNYYKIKLDNLGFKIGLTYGQGISFSCERVFVDNEQEFIDFNDIITDKKKNNVDEFDIKLNTLADYIKNIYEQGVPGQAIVSTLINAISYIETKENKKVKKLIKK